MSCCGIAGKYDDGRSPIEEELDSFFGISAYGRIFQISIGTAGIVAEIAVVVLGEKLLELFEDRQSSESRIEESDHRDFSYLRFL